MSPSVERSATIAPTMQDHLRTIEGMEATQQFLMLTRWILVGTTGEALSLIDFASDPASSPSTLVRAAALERGLDYILYRNDPAAYPYREQALQLLPDNHREHITYCRSPNDMPSGSTTRTGSYRNAAAVLAANEGIPDEYVFPDWHLESFDPLAMDDYNPRYAFMILVRLALEPKHELPISIFTRLVPLALEIQQKLGDESLDIEPQYAQHLTAVGKLARLLSTGEHYAQPIEQFLRSNDPEQMRYVDALNRLYDNAALLRKIFPPSMQRGVEQGVRELIADATYALQAYFAQQKACNVLLPLNGSLEHGLRLQLQGDEPLYLLESLATAIQQLYSVVAAPDLRTLQINAAADQGFQVHRLFVPGQQNVSVYIRPHGAVAYDQQLEYGRLGEGVEASISYVVDPYLVPNKILEIGKHHGTEPDGRISIRVDFEGGLTQETRGTADAHRDPTAPRGTLSLDVGSVLGQENWLSTRVGRLLGWGNWLRATALGTATSLNHAAHQFGAQHELAEAFAVEAERLNAHFGAPNRSMSIHEIAQFFLGTTAVGLPTKIAAAQKSGGNSRQYVGSR